MHVIRADVLGFCHGVHRAVDVIEAATRRGVVYSLGPIVHNEQVTARLADLGMRLVTALDEVPDGGTVAVTAHGAESETLDRIAERGLGLVDATCPIVRRVQQTAAEQSAAGRTVVVYGRPSHPEVRGILSRVEGRGTATESTSLDGASIELPLALLAQTTAEPADFERFVESMKARFGEWIVAIDTTCPETLHRYHAARELAARVDAMVVVGSHDSANTNRLAEICRVVGVPTFHISGPGEMQELRLDQLTSIGLTAGTSTPDSLIEGVLRRLRSHG